MNIVSIFSGREKNLKILNKYLQKALDLNIIDEVHFWNFTRNSYDEEFLKSISNLKRTSSTESGNYIQINPLLSNNSFDLNIKASSDIHIKIISNGTEYEIILGGCGNTKSFIKENNSEIFKLQKNDVADGNNYNNFKIVINDDILNVFKNDEILISQRIKKNFEIKKIFFKTGNKSVGNLTYNTTKNKGFYFMDTCEKTWKNYYEHYNDKEYENDIIVKCDDDIVFIDLDKLPQFLDFVKNSEYDLIFANTINNGVSAYYQQNKYNLIPKELMNLELPMGGYFGSLWENGKKAETLHNYFIENYKKFLNYDYKKEIIQIDTRFSINFFGYRGKNWNRICDSYVDDESNLTEHYVEHRNFKNILYSEFYVSHLSFYKQNETGINLNDLIEKYNKLYYLKEENREST